MQLKGSTFIVTGGASGLGGATARMVVQAGGNVIIADLKEAEGQAHAKDLGANAKFVRTDVTDEASAKGAVAAAVAAFGAVHGLVNCAGIVYGEKVVGKEGPHSLAGFVRVININLIGTFNVLRLAAEAMARIAAAWPCAWLISDCFSPSDRAMLAARAPFARWICSCCLPSDVAITARFSRSAVICACIACRISFGGVRSLIS